MNAVRTVVPESAARVGHRLSDYDFELPSELIAQQPAVTRTASRLLDARDTTALQHRRFSDLPLCLRAGDLLVLNDTRQYS